MHGFSLLRLISLKVALVPVSHTSPNRPSMVAMAARATRYQQAQLINLSSYRISVIIPFGHQAWRHSLITSLISCTDEFIGPDNLDVGAHIRASYI